MAVAWVSIQVGDITLVKERGQADYGCEM
jgi:hypothetical protein